ncbi:MAG: apolipoprotein N-acyltransferase, partial [Microbacteriaceae bacterium]
MTRPVTVRADAPSGSPPGAILKPTGRPWRTLNRSSSVLVAALAGPVIAGGFPGLNWWPLAFLGTILMLWALRDRSFAEGLLVGLVGGFSFFGTLIFWSTVYLGPVPWLALTVVEAFFFSAGAALISLLWRWAPRVWPSAAARVGLVPVLVAGVWVCREAVSSVWPYGGFSWGRLAFSQSESPFAPLAAYLGASGLSFVVAWLCAFLLQLRFEMAAPRGARAAIALAALASVLVIPAWPVSTTGSIRVAAVQGNANAGLFASYTPGQILQDHVAGTLPLIGKKVDLIVWPENASDLNPLQYPQSAAILDYLTQKLAAPLITGTITEQGNRTFNSLLLWQPGRGAVAQYDKMHPVPFAEYLPDRSFWYPLAPDLFKLIPRDYTIGTRPNVFDINGIKAGLAICFDIVDDHLIRKMMAGGAQFIVAPTNNADFGRTDESVQQLAIARLRAIETARSVVNISTVGTSAIIGPRGETISRLP